MGNANASALENNMHVEPLSDCLIFLEANREHIFKVFKGSIFVCSDVENCFNEALKNIWASLQKSTPVNWDKLPDQEKLLYLIAAFRNQGRKILKKCVECTKQCPIDDIITSYSDNEVPNPYDNFDTKENIEIIKGLLTTEQYDLIYKYEGEQLSSKEVGEEMNLKDGTVRQKSGRIISRLRKSLKSLGIMD
jgi:hypothetical protein